MLGAREVHTFWPLMTIAIVAVARSATRFQLPVVSEPRGRLGDAERLQAKFA